MPSLVGERGPLPSQRRRDRECVEQGIPVLSTSGEVRWVPWLAASSLDPATDALAAGGGDGRERQQPHTAGGPPACRSSAGLAAGQCSPGPWCVPRRRWGSRGGCSCCRPRASFPTGQRGLTWYSPQQHAMPSREGAPRAGSRLERCRKWRAALRAGPPARRPAAAMRCRDTAPPPPFQPSAGRTPARLASPHLLQGPLLGSQPPGKWHPRLARTASLSPAPLPPGSQGGERVPRSGSCAGASPSVGGKGAICGQSLLPCWGTSFTQSLSLAKGLHCTGAASDTRVWLKSEQSPSRDVRAPRPLRGVYPSSTL